MMAHIHKASYDHHHWLFMLVFLVLSYVASSSDPTEPAILLKFKSFLSNDSALDNWTNAKAPCNSTHNLWAGLLCNGDGNVYGLALTNMGLLGIIDIDTLMDLSALKTISFMNNSFEGPLPSVNKLSSLTSVYLSHNKFNGEIPDNFFVGMNSLKKIYLDGNEFTGKIPKSLADLTKIVEMDIRGNQFSGKLPNFPQNPNAWKTLNVSYNRLEGRIPAGLRVSNPSAFVGNPDLCGKPLAACKSLKKKVLLIIAIVVISVAAILFFIVVCLKRRRSAQSKQVTRVQNKLGANHDTGAMEVELAAEEENNNFKNNAERGGGELYFLKKDRNFELEELLRAPAEVLGSGSFGSSYKAGLLSGSMVVKRFKQMNQVRKDDFYDHMRRLGRLSHPNLLPLVAFYYRKEEKLLVHDFVANGSLASHLHAKREPGQPGLNWPTRLMIIKGVARGLAYLYKEFPGLTLPHGHLKSSNVLLDHNFNPLLAEYALIPLVNTDHAQKFMVAFKSPEFYHNERSLKKTDVWSLGILIFEMLTGKFPANYLQPGKRANADLAAWVNSVVREEWTGEVFDKDMKGTTNGEGEMLKMLKIGMCCCESSVERRWDWREVVDKIEELKERDGDEDYSSYASDGDVYSSRAISEDDFSFSVNA
ncbi:probable LRR receptor-like serine/threonine-protein kinase At4g31250 [Malus sylvestris]|uniref:probable LRR receptor-like serine/threonine-protein kinase At4g31250 n=1 Tax=Malus sylvestris TaxID=3752 RepID=UPI0021AC7B67|nr:probable LRR receptor-like serine/threonine-protein kinase At4g31250 [Malus sylvestris]